MWCRQVVQFDLSHFLHLTQKNFVRTLKESARITGIHVHLVAHMRKGENETRIGDKMDIKGSGEITDLADYAFIVFKNVEKHRELQNAAQAFAPLGFRIDDQRGRHARILASLELKPVSAARAGATQIGCVSEWMDCK